MRLITESGYWEAAPLQDLASHEGLGNTNTAPPEELYPMIQFFILQSLTTNQTY